MPFDYPQMRSKRRHGPYGYLSYRRYKPWLRDEFTFRCVYCLVRETWYPTRGWSEFHVDHVDPKSEFKELTNEYKNLVYSCKHCNQFKSDSLSVPRGDKYATAKHLRVLGNGVTEPLSLKGQQLIEELLLNDPELVEFRRAMIVEHNGLSKSAALDDQQTLARKFGFPASLPDLSTKFPPGNKRPEGVAESYHARRAKGFLPSTFC